MLLICCDELLSGSVEGLVESHQSSRKYRIVGFLVTQKDLMDLTSFLGVHMDRHSNGRKVILTWPCLHSEPISGKFLCTAGGLGTCNE